MWVTSYIQSNKVLKVLFLYLNLCIKDMSASEWWGDWQPTKIKHCVNGRLIHICLKVIQREWPFLENQRVVWVSWHIWLHLDHRQWKAWCQWHLVFSTNHRSGLCDAELIYAHRVCFMELLHKVEFGVRCRSFTIQNILQSMEKV